jgi:hypothetical protein
MLGDPTSVLSRMTAHVVNPQSERKSVINRRGR